MVKRIGLLALTILLGGCASMADQLHGSLEPPLGEGRAIVSLTAWAFQPDRTNAGVEYQGLDDPSIHGTLYASMLTDSVFGEEGMSPVEGKLELLTLPPGNYRFTEAFGYTSEDDFPVSIGPRIVRLPVNSTFRIQPGKTVYLGEIRLDLSYKPELILKNSQKRDFGHIHRVWHVSDTSRIEVQPLVAAPGGSKSIY